MSVNKQKQKKQRNINRKIARKLPFGDFMDVLLLWNIQKYGITKILIFITLAPGSFFKVVELFIKLLE